MMSTTTAVIPFVIQVTKEEMLIAKFRSKCKYVATKKYVNLCFQAPAAIIRWLYIM